MIPLFIRISSYAMIMTCKIGVLQYVAMTGEQPFFSKITLGMLFNPASTTARDVIAGESFIYFAFSDRWVCSSTLRSIRGRKLIPTISIDIPENDVYALAEIVIGYENHAL